VKSSRKGAVHIPSSRSTSVKTEQSLYYNTTLLEPVLEQHQHPDHRSVVVGVAFDVRRGQLVYEFRADDTALLQVGQAVERKLPQGLVRLHPRAERQSETVLGLGDDLVGKKAPAVTP